MWSNVNQEYSSIDMWHKQSEEDKKKKKKQTKKGSHENQGTAWGWNTANDGYGANTPKFFALLLGVVAIVSLVGYVSHPNGGQAADSAIIQSNADVYGFGPKQCRYLRNNCKDPLIQGQSVAMIAGSESTYVSFKLQIGSLEEQQWTEGLWASIFHVGNENGERMPSLFLKNEGRNTDQPGSPMNDPRLHFSTKGAGPNGWKNFNVDVTTGVQYTVEMVTRERTMTAYLDGVEVGTLTYGEGEDISVNPMGVWVSDPWYPSANAVLADLVVCSEGTLISAPDRVSFNTQTKEVCASGEKLGAPNQVLTAPVGVSFELQFDVTVYSRPAPGQWASVVHVGEVNNDRGPGVWVKGGDGEMPNEMLFAFRTLGTDQAEDVYLTFQFGVEMQFRVVIDEFEVFIYLDNELRAYRRDIRYKNRVYGSEVPVYAPDPWYGAADATVKNVFVAGDPNPPTDAPTSAPTLSPTKNPTTSPTRNPTTSPTTSPTKNPTTSPTKNPTTSPTKNPTTSPTKNPTTSPTKNPTTSPTKNPTTSPTKNPTSSPTKNPTTSPTRNPTTSPTRNPTTSPTKNPTTSPTKNPTTSPTRNPTTSPTKNPTTSPTKNPTTSPTRNPTTSPTKNPTTSPTKNPTTSPTKNPTTSPSSSPTKHPTPEFETVPVSDPQYPTMPYQDGTYDNYWDAVLDVTRVGPLCEIRSIHDNGREDRRFAIGWCNPSDGQAADLGPVNQLPETQFREEWTRSCPDNQFMMGVKSWHDNGQEDRKWEWRCAAFRFHAVDDYIQGNCLWDANWFNSYDAYFKKTCPGDKVLVAVHSQYNTGTRDRQFKFECCDVVRDRRPMPDIDLTTPQYDDMPWADTEASYDNYWDEVLDVTRSSAICEVRSEHNNGREDRLFAFGWCAVTSGVEEWGPLNVLPMTSYRETWTRECPTYQFVVGLWSQHNNGQEDRLWKFRCAEFGPSDAVQYVQAECEWDGNWYNEYDAKFVKTCPKDKVLAGMESTYNTGTKDRLFKFKCCHIEPETQTMTEIDLDIPQYPDGDYTDGYYDNYWDAELDVTRDDALCEIRSIHDNGREDRRYALGSCAPRMGFIAYGTPKVLGATDWDATWTRTCAGDQFMVGIKSWHDNGKEDRRFEFRCATFGPSLGNRYVQGNCEWDNEWYNDWDTLFVKTCPHNKVLTGVTSMHDNGKEDRLFKFQCCSISLDITPDMDLWTPQYPGGGAYNGNYYDNNWDALLDVTRTAGPLCEVRSYHDNGREDRRYALGWCPPILGGATWGPVNTLPTTGWDATWTRVCPHNQVMVGVRSVHDNGKEDRTFQWRCKEFGPTLPNNYVQSNCEWDYNWFNGWDAPFVKTCPTNKVLTGVISTHDNHREDRLFRFQCCGLGVDITPGIGLNGPSFPSLPVDGAWDNDWDAPLDVTRSHFLCEVKSEHHNSKEDRRFALGSCGPQINGVEYGPINTLTETMWDAEWTRTCPEHQFIIGIHAWHDNGKEDRVFEFRCAEFGVNLAESYVQGKCEWDVSWFNAWDATFTKTCPRGKVLAGVHSIHDNGREDRLFRFQCCSIMIQF